MRVLCVLSQPALVRHFGSVIELLGERGHRVHVAFERTKDPADLAAAEALAARHDSVTLGMAPRLPRGAATAGYLLRAGIDYLQCFDPVFAGTILREITTPAMPPIIRRAIPASLARRPRLRRIFAASARTLEHSLPPLHSITDFIRESRPDVVVVTPLVELGSLQPEYLRAAKALGIPTVYSMASWDNLFQPHLVHGEPDLVTVWNEDEAAIAVEMHGLPRDSVVMVGAHPFEQWLVRDPALSYERFCKRVGLNPEMPFLLYLCSSPPAFEEDRFVERWLKAIRSGSHLLKETSVLIRPYPTRKRDWSAVVSQGNVAIWPPQGSLPIDELSRSDYFDSLHHAAAVVGVSTSAMVEAAVLGTPVHTLLLPELRRTQGFLHFPRLLPENGGPALTASSFDEHVAQIERSLEGDAGYDERIAGFIERFIMGGASGSPTARVVEAIESAAATPACNGSRHHGERYAALGRLAAAVGGLRRMANTSDDGVRGIRGRM